MAFRSFRSICAIRPPCFATSNVNTAIRCFADLKPVIPDPERPKRPPSAWLLFLKDFREQIKQKNAELKGKEVMSAASTEWKALDADAKKKWEEPSKQEKEIYAERIKEYVESGKKEAWASDPERPKKPLSAYLLFSQEYRAQHTDRPTTELMKDAASAWRALTVEKKAAYEKKYQLAKLKFEKDLAAYKASGKEAAWKEKVGLKALEDKIKAAAEKKKLQDDKAKTKLKKAMELVKSNLKQQQKLKKQKGKERETKLKLKLKAAASPSKK
jgi:hypothetical protein